MPIGWVAAAAVVGGAISADGARNAAATQAHAAADAAKTQADAAAQARKDQAPYTTAGSQAVDQLSKFYGLGGTNPASQPLSYADWAAQQNGKGQASDGVQGGVQGAAPTQEGYQQYLQQQQQQNNPDFQKILSSQPGYQFQLDQGNQMVQRNLAAKGLLNSGAAGKALTQYGQGVAQNYAQQYTGGLQSLAGLGQSATQNQIGANTNASNNISNAQIYSGNAQAQGAINSANSYASAVQSLGGLAGQVYSGGQQQQLLANDGYQQYQRQQKMDNINSMIKTWETGLN